MNILHLALMFVKYLTYTCSELDKRRFEQDLKRKGHRRQSRASVDVRKQLNEIASESSTDWSALLKPCELVRCIKRYHRVGNVFIIGLVAQILVLSYMVFKCYFHLMFTGSNYELAKYYELEYHFPRIFSSHETPHVFYKHTLALCSYCLSVRVLALIRLIHNAIKNREIYAKVYTTQINLSVYAHLNMELREWLHLVKYSLRHRAEYMNDYDIAEAHMKLDWELLQKTSSLTQCDLIYHTNPIDFSKCYEAFFTRTKSDTSSSSLLEKRSLWSNSEESWPFYRLDISSLGMTIIVYLAGIMYATLGVTLVIFFTIYFELDGAVREHGKQLTIMETIQYLPEYFEEPWRLLRFLDMMIFTFMQLPSQFDAAVYYNDVMILHSRACKILRHLKMDQELCSYGAGEYYNKLFTKWRDHFKTMSKNSHYHEHDLFLKPSSVELANQWNYSDRPLQPEEMSGEELRNQCENIMWARYESWSCGMGKKSIDYLTPVELELINRRLDDLIRLSRVLRSEFSDIREYHSAYLNTMIIYSGFCIAYCTSLILNATSYSTFFSLIINSVAAAIPMVLSILVSILLDRKLKGINRNINLLLVNKRLYLTRETIQHLMIESQSFASSKDRSIQIAGQFPITPESLGTLIAYISTCILLLNRF